MPAQPTQPFYDEVTQVLCYNSILEEPEGAPEEEKKDPSHFDLATAIQLDADAIASKLTKANTPSKGWTRVPPSALETIYHEHKNEYGQLFIRYGCSKFDAKTKEWDNNRKLVSANMRGITGHSSTSGHNLKFKAYRGKLTWGIWAPSDDQWEKSEKRPCFFVPNEFLVAKQAELSPNPIVSPSGNLADAETSDNDPLDFMYSASFPELQATPARTVKIKRKASGPPHSSNVVKKKKSHRV